ncbi:MAG: ThuA domain-containing protein [Clostridia bacterium]|nr:ThuA domain-containing protein [Clostridia bacterium]
MINVTVFNEFKHEKEVDAVKAIYPDGIHNALKRGLEDEAVSVKTVTLDDENCGITDELLENTDVFIWWGHMAHHLVPDEIAEKVKNAVLKGMGIIFLHSSHHSKPFKLLMGTSCNLTWREDGDRELVWVCNPSHPIAQGIGRFIHLEHEETYGEPFGIPEPDELVFIGNFEGGEVFRAGCCWRKEYGKVFYFQPGHETFPIFHNRQILKVIKNAIHWAKPGYRVSELECPHVKKPLED